MRAPTSAEPRPAPAGRRTRKVRPARGKRADPCTPGSTPPRRHAATTPPPPCHRTTGVAGWAGTAKSGRCGCRTPGSVQQVQRDTTWSFGMASARPETEPSRTFRTDDVTVARPTISRLSGGAVNRSTFTEWHRCFGDKSSCKNCRPFFSAPLEKQSIALLKGHLKSDDKVEGYKNNNTVSQHHSKHMTDVISIPGLTLRAVWPFAPQHPDKAVGRPAALVRPAVPGGRQVAAVRPPSAAASRPRHLRPAVAARRSAQGVPYRRRGDNRRPLSLPAPSAPPQRRRRRRRPQVCTVPGRPQPAAVPTTHRSGEDKCLTKTRRRSATGRRRSHSAPRPGHAVTARRHVLSQTDVTSRSRCHRPTSRPVTYRRHVLSQTDVTSCHRPTSRPVTDRRHVATS